MRRNKKTHAKLFLILNQLPKKELKKLDKFLRSPYHNTNERVSKLYREMIKVHPDITGIDKEKIYRKVYPEKKKTDKINEGSLRDLLSQLNKLIHEFLILEELDKDTLIQERLHLKMLTRYKHSQKFKESYSNIMEGIEAKPSDTHQLYHRYKVEDQAYIFTTLFDNRASNSNLQEMVNAFDEYYLSTKLKYLAVMYNREHIVDYTFSYKLKDEVLNYVKSNDVDSLPPTIVLYYQLLLLLIEYKNKENFAELKLSLKKFDSKEVAKMELRQIYTIAINCCRWNILQGNDISFYATEAYAFYHLMIKDEVIFIDNWIQPSHFRNLVYYAILLKDWKGAEAFIAQYKERLPTKHRTNIISYTKAALSFAQGAIEEAHSFLSELLLEHEFIDVYYHLYLKTLLIQIQFMKQDFETLAYSLESFTKYLSRKPEIPSLYIKSYKNFIKIVKNKLKPNSSIKPSDFNGSLAEREWLMTI